MIIHRWFRTLVTGGLLMTAAFVVYAAATAAAAASATAAGTESTIKLKVNGQEVVTDVAPQIINDRLMVPARWIAEKLDVHVSWDEQARIASFNSVPVSREDLIRLIEGQSRGNGSYYFDGLAYESVPLNIGEPPGIIAKIDGAVHLGQFFVFEADAGALYRLVTEQDLKIESWNPDRPLNWNGKNLFSMTARTGGTGTDVTTAHLWYVDQGRYVEAWKGLISERTVLPGGNIRAVTGGYHVDTDRGLVYHWQTEELFASDAVTPVATPTTHLSLDRLGDAAVNPPAAAQEAGPAAEQIVEQAVRDFGQKLKYVSLLAPAAILREAMHTHYGDLVAPELIANWMAAPLLAPGRLTSSPWPERIEIELIEKLAADRYQVTGYIVEATNVEGEVGEAAAKKPITLVLSRVSGRWVITDLYIEVNRW